MPVWLASPRAIASGSAVVPVRNCRDSGKTRLKLNTLCSGIAVDPETYNVTVDGDFSPVNPRKS